MGHTYRATGLAMVIGIGDCGAIIGTELYRIPLGSIANRNYRISHILAIVWLVIGIIAATSLYIGLKRQNDKWDAEERTKDGTDPSASDEKLKSWQRSYRYQL